ncbi:MAG TPA: LON peptidase substrate-binding domain-containing protein [Candidatus Limnocylindria bacterium]|nr:LON peptidase substrate-binding domain-containing protein [Candidatus Limnocylindria bacterium]
MAETRPLPLFPLGSVLFPGMLLPLHIFEPRYRLLLQRVVQNDEPFGIVLIKAGPEVGGPAEPHRIGTTARVVGSTPLPGGRSFIIVRGERRFEIGSIDADSEPYRVATVRYLDEDDGADAAALADIAADSFGQYLTGIMSTSNDARTEVPLAELRDGTPAEVAYRIAGGLGIDAAERQRLLETERTAPRLEAIIGLLGRENTLLKELLLRLRARGEAPPLN